MGGKGFINALWGRLYAVAVLIVSVLMWISLAHWEVGMADTGGAHVRRVMIDGSVIEKSNGKDALLAVALSNEVQGGGGKANDVEEKYAMILDIMNIAGGRRDAVLRILEAKERLGGSVVRAVDVILSECSSLDPSDLGLMDLAAAANGEIAGMYTELEAVIGPDALIAFVALERILPVCNTLVEIDERLTCTGEALTPVQIRKIVTSLYEFNNQECGFDMVELMERRLGGVSGRPLVKAALQSDGVVYITKESLEELRNVLSRRQWLAVNEVYQRQVGWIIVSR